MGMPKFCTCGHEVGEHLTVVEHGVKRGWSSCNECGCAMWVPDYKRSTGSCFVPTVGPRCLDTEFISSKKLKDFRVRFDAFRQSLENASPITEDDIDAATAEVKAARKANRERKETLMQYRIAPDGQPEALQPNGEPTAASKPAGPFCVPRMEAEAPSLIAHFHWVEGELVAFNEARCPDADGLLRA
jgi:hypothetical protein